jgi:hypothetical protein
LQSFRSLSTARGLYNGPFVLNEALLRELSSRAGFSDRVDKLRPALGGEEFTGNVTEQVTPLAGRLFGMYTFLAGVIRVYAAYHVTERYLYQMAWWAYVAAAFHFTSETVVYRSIRFNGSQAIPYMTAYTGAVWMVAQYQHYVRG